MLLLSDRLLLLMLVVVLLHLLVHLNVVVVAVGLLLQELRSVRVVVV
jgi:hypothetical protein